MNRFTDNPLDLAGPRPSARRAGPPLAAVVVGVVAITAALGPAGCSRPPVSPPDSAPPDSAPPIPDVAGREVSQGPATLNVTWSPQSPRLADRLQLTVTVRTRPGVQVFPPEFSDSLGDFRIVEQRAETPRLGSDRDTYRYHLTLEPPRPGPARLLPIPITFHDPRTDADGERQTIESPALELEIRSGVAPQEARLEDVTGLEQPIRPPASGWFGPVSAILGLVLAALGLAGAWLWWRQRRATSRSPEIPPREAALRELQRLRRERLAERDVKQFFIRLTGIVRTFIERTTGVLAAEQTTEEFLRAIGRGQVYGEQDRARLKEFLESADQVKFAAHHPRAADIERAFDGAREFVSHPDTEPTPEARPSAANSQVPLPSGKAPEAPK